MMKFKFVILILPLFLSSGCTLLSFVSLVDFLSPALTKEYNEYPETPSFFYCGNDFFKSSIFIDRLNSETISPSVKVISVARLDDINGPEHNYDKRTSHSMQCKATLVFADRHQELGIISAYNTSSEYDYIDTRHPDRHPELEAWGKGQNLEVTWRANKEIKQQIKEVEQSLHYWSKQKRRICYTDEDSGSSRVVYDSRSPESLPNVHCTYTANPEEAPLKKELEELKKRVQ